MIATSAKNVNVGRQGSPLLAPQSLLSLEDVRAHQVGSIRRCFETTGRRTNSIPLAYNSSQCKNQFCQHHYLDIFARFLLDTFSRRTTQKFDHSSDRPLGYILHSDCFLKEFLYILPLLTHIKNNPILPITHTEQLTQFLRDV